MWKIIYRFPPERTMIYSFVAFFAMFAQDSEIQA